MVYSRRVEGKVYTFGISGRLFKSNVLLYDHQTESLWSQLLKKAITGPMVKKKLTQLIASRIKWKTWRKRHPKTLVLSDKTGYQRNYSIDPYEGYYRMGSLMFPVGKVRKDLPAKERILGIEIDKIAKAYPLEILTQRAGVLKDRIKDVTVQIVVDAEGEIVAVMNQEGKPIPHTFTYWFAWQAFHPKTKVYQ